MSASDGVVAELFESRIRAVEERNRRIEKQLLESQGEMRRVDRTLQEVKDVVTQMRDDIRALVSLVGAKEAL